MARPPRRPIARNPSPATAAVARLRPVEDAGAASVAEDGRSELDLIADGLVEELAAALEDGGVLDANDRAALRSQVEAVLREQVDATASGHASPPAPAASGRSEWIETIEGLRKNGVLTEDDANALVRQLDTILSPAQNKDVELAVEFGRRFQEEGQERALAWFKAQLSATPGEGTAAGGAAKPSDPPLALATAIVNSKSRRVRGPPRR